MSFLRLSVSCAVFDDNGYVLLSQRGDLNVWNLPGGRLDSGELLASAATREVYEETGIVAHIERAVGVYYWAGWERLNVLFTGFPVGGQLAQRTAETRQNQWFAPHALPAIRDSALIGAALNVARPMPQLISSPVGDLARVRWALRQRYVFNWLRGTPEPRYVRFNTQAVAIVWETSGQRVLTVNNQRLRALPRIVCDGRPPWVQLQSALRPYLAAEVDLQWAGVWQDTASDSVEWVFAATIAEQQLSQHAEWSPAQNIALNERDAAYLGRTPPDYARQAPWL
ncbi:MAG: NUDIX domain-containing protein [Armatimonadetes bacterium]|nr:NUDIX domain-containing protein [Anaerolineae bacterium]